MKKFNHAFRGLKLLFCDHGVLIQLFFACCTLILTTYLQFELNDQIIIIICILMVCVIEMVNTVIEKLADLYTKEINDKIRNIKDMAAGFTLFTALIALIIGLILLSKYL